MLPSASDDAMLLPVGKSNVPAARCVLRHVADYTWLLRTNLILFRATHSVIASGNTGTPRDTVYPWGKGINKQKTNNCRLRRLFGQKCSLWRIARKGHRIIKPTQDTFVLAWRRETTNAVLWNFLPVFSITQLLLTIKLFLTNVLFFLAKCSFG